MGLNRVQIIGYLGRDPEMRTTPTGKSVTNFTVAVDDTYNDRDGQRRTRTEWFYVVTWGKLAEACGQHLCRGRQVYVEGRLATRDYTVNDEPRRTVEIVASTVQFLGSKQFPVGSESSSDSQEIDDI